VPFAPLISLEVAEDDPVGQPQPAGTIRRPTGRTDRHEQEDRPHPAYTQALRPPRQSALQLAFWILVALGVVALIGFFVFAALTFEGGGDDAAIGALPA